MRDENSLREFEKLKRIIAQLRSPEGCPWDREQTHKSLKPYLIEECYEVLQAIDEGDDRKLCDELGDLLLQIMLHAQIADEKKEYTIEDVIEGLCKKLIKRHPHVFGQTKVKNSAEVTHNWDIIKKEERGDGGSLLESIPEQLPALSYSQSLQRRVASTGFDWEKTEEVLDKLNEEVQELINAKSNEEKEREIGDLIFTLVNIGRKMDINMEMALRETNRRFYKRYSYMEEKCRNQGNELKDLDLDEQNRLWEQAKKNGL